ncbi:MAG: class I SAM-dependent methyltransferase [Leptospiraceae bacterium]|nr:class I SAM-dependent methyltransferase [Leptospiraceae bacterium]
MQNWELLFTLGKKNLNLEVLNLFAYSGVSTLYCLSSGMKVCHVDSSKGMVEWAKENVKLSGLESMPVRWIVDDVIKFIKREIRRKKTYNGFILDPPTFGRGAKGEVWKIEENLPQLMELLMQLCNFKPKFVFLSCHTTGYSPIILERILKSLIQEKGGYTSGEMFIEENSGNKLSGGFFANFLSQNLAI